MDRGDKAKKVKAGGQQRKTNQCKALERNLVHQNVCQQLLTQESFVAAQWMGRQIHDFISNVLWNHQQQGI